MPSPFQAAALLLLASLASSACTASGTRSERVPSADGVAIAYESHGPRVAGPELPALVFVHCWAGNRRFWREQVETFSEHRRVVTLDLAGHGESGRARATWSIEGLAADVLAVADALGLERLVLIGHSMGGPVSLAAARAMPGRVLAVVPVDTLQDADFELPPGFIEELARRFEADFPGTMRGFVGQMFTPRADPDVVRWTLAQAIDLPDRTAAVALLRGFTTLDRARLLFECGVPVRAINSTLGIPTSVEHNRKYADFELVSIADVGHFLPLERPQEFNAALARVLADLEVGAAGGAR
jgi:pimeloyl-ACP methyl ester carboxylesterase